MNRRLAAGEHHDVQTAAPHARRGDEPTHALVEPIHSPHFGQARRAPARMQRLVIGGLTISLDALAHNAALLRELAGPARSAFVVKGNAYGHGLVPVARTIEPVAVRLCVYSLDEALQLRLAGVTVPILVLGPIPPGALEEAVSAKIELALWSAGEFARHVCAAARKCQRTAAVHVKINTDLNRLGFEPHEFVDAVEDLLALPEIEIAGIFSHLASAEELDSPYTMHQLDQLTARLHERSRYSIADLSSRFATSRHPRQPCSGHKRVSIWCASASRSMVCGPRARLEKRWTRVRSICAPHSPITR